ncbi:hypothetical protein BSPWISOXPB_4331 [uncultured Gammaproteobacteria bacterium]|nr:hypothetical protein BSPWISOXPB_4331 [uncultured Gammaproteobacteria bacterium]
MVFIAAVTDPEQMTGFHRQPMMSEKSLTHLTGFE